MQTPFHKSVYVNEIKVEPVQSPPKIIQGSDNINDIGKDENYGPVQKQPSHMPLIFNDHFKIDEAAPLQFKYSILLNTEVEKLENIQLYQIIDEWLGTPYRIGGMTQRGIDCSGLARSLVFGAYKIDLPRTAREQKQACIPITNEELKEGDLVFFNTRGGVSHVGMYLHNNKFVHASTSYGVIISDLAESYWSRRYLGAGRYVRDNSDLSSNVKK
ncbi:MAG: C40 family peptidase [Chitinophagaceae bacterium]